MSHAFSYYASARQKRKQRRKKLIGNSGTSPRHVVRKMSAPAGDAVTLTIADAQRQNREASKQWKATARKIAAGFSIGLHAVGLIVLGVYFIRRTVLEMNKDAVQSVIVTDTKPKPKRRTQRRETRPAQKPKAFKIRAPKGQPVTTSAKIPMGNARFTLPTSDVSTRSTMALSTEGLGRNLFTESRQANIVTTMPKFEVPKFETTSLVTRMDMSTSLAQMEFNAPGNLELAAVDFGSAKQSLNEFLKQVRERIKRVQRFPPRVRNLADDTATTVRFTLFKDGTVQHTEVTASSGSRALDNAAIAAVQNAVPYPPFPDGHNGGSLRLELPIVFEVVN